MSVVYPHVFLEGPEAMIVSSALDPDVLLRDLERRGFRPALWSAKLTGSDTGARAEIVHGFERARAHGLRVGGWIQCGPDPRSDVNELGPWAPSLDFVELCCELEYKSNAGDAGDAGRAEELVDELRGSDLRRLPTAIVSYGRADAAMHLATFAAAGFAVRPECYGPPPVAAADSYVPTWPGRAIHPLVHTLAVEHYRGNRCSIYRPEGLL